MKPFTTIASVVFALVAAGHAVRLCFGWEVTVAGVHLPPWLSVFGTIVPAALAFLLWREARRK